MEELILNFPHILESIFEYLDDESLEDCQKVSKEWSDFIRQRKFYWRRITKPYQGWKEAVDNVNSGIIQTLGEILLAQKRPCHPIFCAIYLKDIEILAEISKLYQDFDFVNNHGNYPIHSAVKTENAEIVELILSKTVKNKNPPSKKYPNLTPLHIVASKGNLCIFRLIFSQLEDEIDLDLLKVADGKTPLHLAAQNGHFELCQHLLSLVKEKNPRDKKLTTPLDEAAKNGHFEICQLYSKENVDFRNAIFLAAINGHLKICQLSNTNPKNSDGETAFHYAAKYGHAEVCRYFMSLSDDKNPADEDGETPLHWAATRGYIKICQLIVEEIEDKNPQDILGKTPLHQAARYGNIAVCKFFIGILEEKNPVTESGWTALHASASGGNLEAFQLFFEQQNPPDQSGETPLHTAVKHSNLEIVEFIIDNVKGDLSLPDIDGRTPLHYAVWEGDLKILSKLLTGANVDINLLKDKDGVTPLDVARMFNFEKILSVLQK